MKSTRTIVLLTSMAVAAAGIGARAEPTATDIGQDDIRHVAIQNLASWNIAFNAGGLDKPWGLYTDDAVLKTPTGELATGQGIQDFWKTVYGVGFNAHGLAVTAVEGEGDQIVVTSRWEALRAPENDVVFEGRMISVLEKQLDGSWKTSYQSWH